jgi:alpha-D-xyloside xylohydrolase
MDFRRPWGRLFLCRTLILWLTASTAVFGLCAAQTPAYSRTATAVTIPVKGFTIVLRPLEDGAIRVQIATGAPPAEVDSLVLRSDLIPPPFQVRQTAQAITVLTGSLRAKIDRTTGELTFLDAKGTVLLAERPDGRALPPAIPGQPAPVLQDSFVSPKDESLFGGGQFQDGFLNIRDLPRRMTQVNTQISIPFFVSSKGYGLLWHNYGRTDLNPADRTISLTPAGNGTYTIEQSLSGDSTTPDVRKSAYFTGEFEVPVAGKQAMMLDSGWAMERRYKVEIDGKTQVDFANYWLPPTTSWFTTLSAGKHTVRVEGDIDDKPTIFFRPAEDQTTLRSFTGKQIDYVVFAGPTSDDVIRRYRDVTGAAPLMPQWAYGYIQCRARYYNQAELLKTLETYREKQIPLDLIVQDWMYWGKYGWNDMRFDETDYPDPAGMLKTVHDLHAHLMISVWSRIGPDTEIGKEFTAKKFYIPGTEWIDFFNPEARKMFWKDVKTRMEPYGIDAWWFDATEPENDDLHGRTVSTGDGGTQNGDDVRLLFPYMVNRTVYQGLRNDQPDKRVMILTRNAFLGQQRFASATWSGDVGNDFATLRREITAGLDYSASGLPYWTTDTGGFFRPGKAQFTDPAYHERLIRWFEFSTFSPLLRIHGWLTPTELWLYGPQVESVTHKYINLRYRMFPYLYSEAAQVTLHGSTLLRPLVMDFAADPAALEQKYEYMFGKNLLVAPVVSAGVDKWDVYLPEAAGGWYDFWTEQHAAGGRSQGADAAIDKIPLFVPAGSILPLGPEKQYVAEKPNDPIELRVYPGKDGAFTLYEDEGTNYNYEKGEYSTIPLTWNDRLGRLEIGKRAGSFPTMLTERTFSVHLAGESSAPRTVTYRGDAVAVKLK